MDDQILLGFQHLGKLFSWHSLSLKKDYSHFKFRPGYNLSIREHPRLFWRYAITSTIYYIRKQKKQESGKKEQKLLMVELCELYKLQQFNAWVTLNFKDPSSLFLLKVESADFDISTSFDSPS